MLQGEKVGAFPDGEGDDIPGYKFVRTETDDSGNVTNIYRKVTTKWVDKNGNPLKDPTTGEYPDKEGDDVPGYKLVGTEVDPDGNVVNIYEKNVNTKWVDTDGNRLKDPVDGPFPDKEGDDIPGYKLTHVNIDDHGNVVNVYDKTVKTKWVDEDGKPLKDVTDGSYPDKEGDDIPGYKFVKTETDDQGNVVNVYKKVVTKWVDEDGKTLKATSYGEHPDKEGDDIPGYKLVKTETDDQGNTVNVYKKVVTKWVDEDGKTLKDVTDGSFPDKEGDDIPGYKFVKTETDDQGNTVNVYKKVVTKWVDENGKPLKDPTDGEHPDKEGDDLPGYKLVKTSVDDQGNIVNVYKKNVNTKWLDENGKTLKDGTDGEHPDKEGDDIPGYKLVKTETDDQGNVINTYKKVVTTKWVDENGKTLKAATDGSLPDKEGDDMPGYELVGVTYDENGNVINTYRKVVTPTPSPAPVQTQSQPLPATGDTSSLMGIIGSSVVGLSSTGMVINKRRKQSRK